MALDNFVSNTRIIGRKRVVIPHCLEASTMVSTLRTPLKRHNSGKFHKEEANRLESLPEDILVRILCKVDHSDLKQLLLVSRPIQKAALSARDEHFAFSTPSAKLFFNRNLDDEEEPHAPRQHRVAAFRIDNKTRASVAVVLF